MRIPNGQCICQVERPASASLDTRHVSDVQSEFLKFILFQGVEELIKSLKLVHDQALYHSDLLIDDDERVALFHVKILWEEMEKLEKEG